jgi:hypothetical protein
MDWILRCISYGTNSAVRTLNAVCGNNLFILRSIQNTDALCGQDVGFLNGKADGTSSNHWARCEVVRWYIDIKDKDGSDGLLVINRYYTMHRFRREYPEGAQLMLQRRASLRLQEFESHPRRRNYQCVLQGYKFHCTFDSVSRNSFILCTGFYVFRKFTEATLSTCPCSVLLIQVSRTICRQV